VGGKWGQVTASVPEYNIWRTQNHVLDDITAYDTFFGGPGINISGGDRPEQVKRANRASGDEHAGFVSLRRK